MSINASILQSPEPSKLDKLFEHSLRDIGIQPCPAALSRIMAEIHKDEPDYKRLTSIISADVGLSAGLIKTANSSYFGIRQRARSVFDALTILGLNASSRAIVCIILRETFPKTPGLEHFWDSSARIARLSGWLAQKLDISGLTSEDAYTFGLFRDCGIPILFKHSPDYEKILSAANYDPFQCFTSTEETILPTNHAIVGRMLAQSWWLPEEIYLAIRHHHDLTMLNHAESQLPILSRRLIAIAQFSEHVLQCQLGLSITWEWAKLGTACLQILDISDSDIEHLYAEARSFAALDE